MGLCGLRPPGAVGLDWLPVARSRLWRIRSATPDRLAVPPWLWALAVRVVSCCCARVCWDGPAICPVVGLCGVCCCAAVPDCALNRKTRELSEVPAEGDGGVVMRLDGSLPLNPPVLRRACKRSNSDPRDVVVRSETLGEEAWGIDLVMLSVPIRLPMLSVPLGRLTSDGCGKELRTLPCVLGE